MKRILVNTSCFRGLNSSLCQSSQRRIGLSGKGIFILTATFVLLLAPTVPRVQSSSNSHVFGHIYYCGFSSICKNPVRYAQVKIWDSDLTYDDLAGSTQTDENGFFEKTFVNDVDFFGDRRCDCYIVVRAKLDSIADISYGDLAIPHHEPDGTPTTTWDVNFKDAVYKENIPDGDTDLGSMVIPPGGVADEAFRVYDSIVSAWLYIKQQTGVEVPKASVIFPCGILCPGQPYFDAYVTHNINMDKDEDRSVHVHEYGHWVMYSAYGEWWPVSFNDQRRCLTHVLEQSCPYGNTGWTEGWADFLPMAVFSNPSANVGVDLETPPPCVIHSDDGVCHNFENGDNVEGRVAATLWDLFDPKDDGRDQYNVPFNTIFDVLWNGGRHYDLNGFYHDFVARSNPGAAFNAAAFQNTINYNNPPQVTAINLRPQIVSVSGSDDTGGYTDGYVREVETQYSLDNMVWHDIGTIDLGKGSSSPYDLTWDMTSLIGQNVWVRAMVVDNLDAVSNFVERSPVVIDLTPPTITVPKEVIAEAQGPQGATVTYDSGAVDNVDGPIALVCDHASASVFPIGSSRVSCTATDSFGNTAAASFMVLVQDTTPPSVMVPPSLVAEATGPSGATVTYGAASAYDLVDGSLPISCTPSSGSIFPLGITTVSCFATDSIGNRGAGTFQVIVQDTTPPDTFIESSIDGRSNVLAGGATTLFQPVVFKFSGFDIVGVAGYECSLDGSGFSACSSPSTYGGLAFGTHSFQVHARDGAGNMDPSPAQFVWVIISPAQASQNLIDIVKGMQLPSSVQSSLIGLLDQARRVLSDTTSSNDVSACSSLASFIRLVNMYEVQGKLTAFQASQLRDMANDVRVALGCQ